MIPSRGGYASAKMLMAFTRGSSKKIPSVPHAVMRRTLLSCTKRYRILLSPHRHAPSISTVRSFSSKDNKFQLDALAFSISPEEALQQFHQWADQEQGLNSLLLRNVRLSAAYVPVWSFDVNVRFVTSTESGRRRYDWKPEPFASAYPSQSSVIYVPGLSAYAGYTYQRSLMDPIHNTTLVYMHSKTMPFGTWMLRDMVYYRDGNKETMQIFPDPWNATRGRALAVVKQELQELASDQDEVQVQTQVVKSRRVYMPTYVVDYTLLGIPYRAFLSGCDAASGVSGVSHKVVSSDTQQAATSFLSQAANAAQATVSMLGTRGMANVFFILLNFFSGVAGRILMRIPVLSLVGGLFLGFRKILQPYLSDRLSASAWERQRDQESVVEGVVDDFVDTSGAAKRHFETNKTRILKFLSGQHVHDQGDYDWYKDWEEWARRQYQQQRQGSYQQQRQQQQQTYQQQQQQQKRRARAKQTPPKKDYQWDFDPNDPYSVLGIRRGATKSQVSEAFRREMLKHHPDVQAGASEAEKERSVERSKLITEAYRKIKAEMKK